MGTYTQLHYGVQLKANTPPQVIETLRYMLGETPKPATLPDHPLFATSRWHYMLRSDSYYFDYKSMARLEFDTIANQFYLSVTSNLKNYDNEIELFVDWMAPYVDDKDPGDFLGYYRYEETETPTLIVYEAAGDAR